jgi:hypothetical protein
MLGLLDLLVLDLGALNLPMVDSTTVGHTKLQLLSSRRGAGGGVGLQSVSRATHVCNTGVK